MAKRRKVLIGLGVMALLLAALPFLWPASEPKYDGRYLSEWLRQAQAERAGVPKMPNTLEAILAIGTNALPNYLDWVAYDQPQWRSTLRRNAPAWMKGRVLDDILIGKDPLRANYAVEGFLILGTNAISAVPALEALMKDSRKERQVGFVMHALAAIGEPSFPILRSALADTNQADRNVIPYALRTAAYQVGTSACVPMLIEATQHRDLGVKMAATNVLKEIAPEVLTKAPSQ